MKILCAISGIEYSVQHFPAGLQARESYHPVFDIRFPHLSDIISKRYPDGFTPTDSYLAFLALLNSTQRIEFRVPCKPTPLAFATCLSYLERLYSIVQTIHETTHPAFSIPHFVINPDNSELQNVANIIDSWAAAYKEFRDGNKRAILHDKIATKEQLLERVIRDPSKNPANYANQIADWAALAGNFPASPTLVGKTHIPLSDYWKQIIRACARGENLISVNDPDLYELIEYCEDKIPHGSSFAHVLMRVLRAAKERKSAFLGLGDFDIIHSTYRILEDTDSAMTANVMAMVDSAPADKPVESNYPSRLAFVKAMFKYEAAVKHRNHTAPVIIISDSK